MKFKNCPQCNQLLVDRWTDQYPSFKILNFTTFICPDKHFSVDLYKNNRYITCLSLDKLSVFNDTTASNHYTEIFYDQRYKFPIMEDLMFMNKEQIINKLKLLKLFS